MEAGKERLTRDNVGDATRAEVQDMKHESACLKQLVAESYLSRCMCSKNGHTGSGIKGRYARVSAEEKTEIPVLVANSGLSRIRALSQLRLPRSTYYRWLKRQTEGKLEDRKGSSPILWNKLRPEEETKMLAEARALPEFFCRQSLY